jgi:hypothetical protein
MKMLLLGLNHMSSPLAWVLEQQLLPLYMTKVLAGIVGMDTNFAALGRVLEVQVALKAKYLVELYRGHWHIA